MEADERKERKQRESIDLLLKFHEDIVQQGENVKKEVQDIISEISENTEEFDDSINNLEEFIANVDDILRKMKCSYEEAEIDIKRTDDEQKMWEVVATFQKEKNATGFQIVSMPKKIREIKRNILKAKKKIEQMNQTKFQIKMRLQKTLNEIKTSADDIYSEIERVCSSKDKFSDFETLKSELNKIENIVKNILIKINEEYQNTLNNFEVTKLKDSNEDHEHQFQRAVDSFKWEITSLREKLNKIVQNHTYEIQDRKKDEDKNKLDVIEKLEEIYNESCNSLKKILMKIDNHKPLIQSTNDGTDRLQSKMDDLKRKLNETNDSLLDHYETTKLKIQRSNDVLEQRACLSAYRRDIQKNNNDVSKINTTFEDIVEMQTKRMGELRKTNIDRIRDTKEYLRKLVEKIKELGEEIVETIDDMMPKVFIQNTKQMLKKQKDSLEKQINDMNKSFEAVLKKLEEKDPNDFELCDKIRLEFEEKINLKDREIKTIQSKVKELIKKYIKSEQKQLKLTLKNGSQETKDRCFHLTEDTKILTQELTQVDADVDAKKNKRRLKWISEQLNRITIQNDSFYDDINHTIEQTDESDFSKREISDTIRKEKDALDSKIEQLSENIDEIRDHHDKTSKAKQDKDSCLLSLETFWKKTKVSANKIKESLTEKISSKKDCDDLKQKLQSLIRDLERLVNDGETTFNETISNTKNNVSGGFDTILSEFCKKMKNIETEINEISVKVDKFIKTSSINTEIIHEKVKDPVSFSAALSRSIRQKASQSYLQLKDENGLNIFKLPIELTHNVPLEKLRRFELGEPTYFKEHRHVMLSGMTGSGKSLLINNMVNYIYGVSHQDKFRFKLIVDLEEKKEREGAASTDEAKSMTSCVTNYTFHWQEGFRIPYSLTIIDTPGFGDTRGLKYDEIIVGQIKKFFNDNRLYPSVTISSIGFLIQASQARLTDEQRYIFDQILQILGKDMTNNIFIIFTFADAQEPPAMVVVKSNEIPHRTNCTFKFNNSAVYAEKGDELSKLAWNFGYKSLEMYFEALQHTESISLEQTKKVLEERDHLRVILESLQEQIQNGMELLRSIEEHSYAIVNMEGAIKANKDYKVKKSTFDCTMKKVSYFITNCKICKSTCHDPCQIAGDKKEGCAAMKDGNCVRCTNKCSYDMHTNGSQVYVYTPIEVEIKVEEMMKDYNVALNEKGAKKKVLTEMLSRYAAQKLEIFQCVLSANKCFNRLQEISLRCAYLSNVDYIDRLIKSEEESSKPFKADRLNYLKHLRAMAGTLKDAKRDENNLPEIVSEYEKTIKTLIETIEDDTVEKDSLIDIASGNDDDDLISLMAMSSDCTTLSDILEVKRK